MGFTAAAAVVAAVATTLTVSSEQQQANSQQAIDGYQAQVAANNQTAATQQAQYAEQQGQTSEQQQQQKTAALVGATRAQEAAHGVDVDGGSALDLQSDDATEGELSALTAENGGQNQAYSDEIRATDDASQAGLYGAKSEFAGQAGRLQVDQTLLGAATDQASTWKSYFAS